MKIEDPVFEEDDTLVNRAEAFISRRRGMLPGMGQTHQAGSLSAKIALGPPASQTLPKAQRVVESIAGKDSEPGFFNEAFIPTRQPELPTLNDVHTPPVTEPAREDLSSIDPDVLKILVSEVSRNISRHITGELPELLYNATLSTLEADLRRGILAATEVAARNFIAQRLKLTKYR